MGARLEHLKLALSRQKANIVDVSQIGDQITVEQARDKFELSWLENKTQENKLELGWKQRYYKLRTIWAILTIVLLAVTLGFTWWLVYGVGHNELNFTKYTSFLNIIAADVIINLLGLVLIVMRFLFPATEKPDIQPTSQNVFTDKQSADS